jgi:hypothetical protein
MAEKKPKREQPAVDPSLPSVAAHPRANAQIARAKAWGGLGGFGLVALLSSRAGVPAADLLLRSVLAGALVYVVAWAGALAVWRQLVLAELRAAHALVQASGNPAQGLPAATDDRVA